MIEKEWLREMVDFEAEGKKVGGVIRSAMKDLPSTLRFMGHYASWNGFFGSGVAALAAKIGRNRSLFIDPKEEVEALADRSVLVASYFFDAARDEFDDRDTAHRDTHRCLAQALVSGLCTQLKNTDSAYTNAKLNELLAEPDWLSELGSFVAHGYGAQSDDRLESIFEAIGYHLGSEVFADQEFSVIDSQMRSLDSSLVSFLSSHRVKIGDQEHEAYHWIRIHSGHGGGAEADHFEWATQGVNLALAYANGAPDERLRGAIAVGYERFAHDHKTFFDKIV